MRVVSPVLKRLVYPALQRASVLQSWSRSGQLAVITYHGVLPSGYRATDQLLDGGWVSRETFRDQLRLLRKRYSVVSPDLVRYWLLGKESLPNRAVLLTCDDGLSNTVSEMLPLLQDEKMSCLFFVTSRSLAKHPAMLWYEELYLTLLAVPSGELNGEFLGVPIHVHLADDVKQRHRVWWKLVSDLSMRDVNTRLDLARALRDRYGLAEGFALRYLEEAAARFRLLNSSEIGQLLNAGMSIGSHTISHPKLSQMSSEDAWMEISSSRKDFTDSFGIAPWSIAYPFGGTDSVSERELEMAERAGYDCGFTNFGGGFGPKTSRFAIPRMHVTLDMNLAEFEAHVCGLHESLRRCIGHVEHIPASPNVRRRGASSSS
jgi:peptidoglycan/xylan/chitin deacetylase (PgdA/CDA1 family)